MFHHREDTKDESFHMTHSICLISHESCDMTHISAFNISESTVRLLFDILHGIKRMDVPFAIALKFAILLGFDGQLEDSDMENELFTSAIDQLKEGSKLF